MRKLILLGMFAALLGGVTAGCGVTSARLVIAPQPVVVHSPPPRVYHQGRWLHYRSNAYHYYHGGTWVVARSVPRHVTTYHRPVHVQQRTYVRSTTRRRSTTTRHRSTTTHRRHRHKLDKDMTTVKSLEV